MEALSKLKVQCKCTYAQAAEQALDMLNYLKPDVIFIDINMPRINGLECARLIRAKPTHPDTHIVIYSSGISDTTLQESLASGANTCLTKTTSIGDLVSAMEKVMGVTQARVPAPARQPLR
jgi:CheY-like chemotaxis protein